MLCTLLKPEVMQTQMGLCKRSAQSNKSRKAMLFCCCFFPSTNAVKEHFPPGKHPATHIHTQVVTETHQHSREDLIVQVGCDASVCVKFNVFSHIA